MNTAKHTQGDWTAEKPGNLWQIYSHGDSMVAQVAMQDTQMDGGRNPEIEEANARLIASAPALLAALQAIAQRAIDYPRSEMAQLNGETARAAIDPMDRRWDTVCAEVLS